MEVNLKIVIPKESEHAPFQLLSSLVGSIET